MAERESLFLSPFPKPPPQVSPPRKKVFGRRENFLLPFLPFFLFLQLPSSLFSVGGCEEGLLSKLISRVGRGKGKGRLGLRLSGLGLWGREGGKEGFWATLEVWTLLASTLCGPRVHFDTFSTRRIFSCIFPHVLQVECIRRQDVFDLFGFVLLVPARAAYGA